MNSNKYFYNNMKVKPLFEVPHGDVLSIEDHCIECPVSTCDSAICSIDYHVEDWKIEQESKQKIAQILSQSLYADHKAILFCPECKILFVYNANRRTSTILDKSAIEKSKFYTTIDNNKDYIEVISTSSEQVLPSFKEYYS